MPVASVSDDPIEQRLQFDEDERRRLVEEARRLRPRYDDEQGERERREELEVRLENERRDRAAGIDRRLERIEAEVSKILPGVADVVNGKIKKLREDVDQLRDAEGGNQVVRTWFRAVLATVGGACVLTIVLWTAGQLHQVARLFSAVSPAPVNPQPSVLFRDTPTPPAPTQEQAGARCQRIALEMGLPEADEREVVNRCYKMKKIIKEERRGP